MHSTGWIDSLRKGYPCDGNGDEIPWMNYAVISILKERLNKTLTLFEYGSGYSTMFYSKLVGQVVSIEYDKAWYDLIEKKVPNNVSLIHKCNDENGFYCRSISEFNQNFDVVIVDGRDRVNCVKQAINKLSDSGVILLDDSSRERYFEAIEFAKEKGFRSLNLEGIKPTGSFVDRTTILYRDNNCLSI